MLRALVRRTINLLGDLIYPRLCPVCEIGLNDHEQICPECVTGFQFTNLGNWLSTLTTSASLDGAWSALWFDEELQALIHQLKYGGRQEVAAALVAIALSGEANLNLEEYDILVPVPLFRTKQRERGFNQAELIAKALSTQWHIPINTHLISRTRWTDSQTGLDIAERIANMAGSFSVKNSKDSERVLLIDDVLTTGATASACAAALKQAGILEVGVFSIATPILEQ